MSNQISENKAVKPNVTLVEKLPAGPEPQELISLGKGATVTVCRSAGHPWDDAPGFDLAHVRCDNADQCRTIVARLERKFWKIWMGATENDFRMFDEVDGQERHYHGAVMYKPSGIMDEWEDAPSRRYKH